MPGKTLSLIIMFILIVAVGAVQAQVSITYSSGDIQHFTMNIVDEWRVNVGSEEDLSRITDDEKLPARLISAMPNDGVPLWFGLWVPDDLVVIEDAEEYMKSLGLDLLTDLLVTDRKLDTLNGMEVYYISGTGKKESETMDFRTVFFQLSPESVAIAIYIGPPETTSSHGTDLVQMTHSLRPVKQETK